MNKINLVALLVFSILIICPTVLATTVTSNITLTKNTTYRDGVFNFANIYLNSGVTLSFINSTVIVGSVTGAGKNGFLVTNTSLSIYSLSISGGGISNVNMENVVITGQSKALIFNNNILSMSNVSFQSPKAETVFLVLRNIKNGFLYDVSYKIPVHYITTSTVAISIEGCINLTLDKINGIGVADVNTPHFHISFAGTLSQNVAIKNSYFYGGGNGGTTTGSVNYLNCTYDNVIDGTEKQQVGLAIFTDCVWKNTHQAEINLQGGITYTFNHCTFNKGLVNLDNGIAWLNDCITQKGITFKDMGDNNHIIKHLGVIYIDGTKIDWNGSDLRFTKIN